MSRQPNDALHPIETPSGKDADYENFPVGSWLLPSDIREHVAVFYHFARAIDDIADNAALLPDEKIQRLEGFAAVLNREGSDAPGYEKALQMRRSLDVTGVSSQHCIDLITAFKQDAIVSRYQTWDQLVDYCLLSAAPVGRYLIDLNNSGLDAYHASDALCVALQVINHVQDCGDDFKELNRVYLPQDWMKDAAANEDMLGATKLTPQLATVVERCLTEVRALLADAAPLHLLIRSRRLSMEAAAIRQIALALAKKLRGRDVLERRIILSKPQYVLCIAIGMTQACLK